MATVGKIYGLLETEKSVSGDDMLFAIANNLLGLKIYEKLSESEGNIFFSPISISTAFSMLYTGCRGVTANEMKDTLGFTKVGIENNAVCDATSKFLTLCENASQKYILLVANALFAQKEFPFLPEFLKTVQDAFRATAHEVDFLHENSKTVHEINEWVKEKTKSMIPTLFSSLDTNTVLVLINAVYFKGKWVHQFNKKATTPRIFYNYGLKSKAREVSMMYVKERFLYTQNDDYQALVLPYEGNDISMVIILPSQRDGLRSLERRIFHEELMIRKGDFRKVNIKVYFPKLHLEYSKELKEIFSSLGLKSLFSPSEADLSGLSNCPDIFVSEAVHKAVLDVNEEGTEAAAATGLVIQCRSLALEREFIVDNPFLFLIKDDRSNAILFLSRIENL